MPIYDTDDGIALLQELARRRGVSAAALMRQLIREEAARVGLTATPRPVRANASASSAEADPQLGQITVGGLRVPSPEEREAPERLRELTDRLRAGEHVPPEAMRREMDILRRHTVAAPPEQTGAPSPEWRAEFRQLLEGVRAGVPEEWSEEELKQRVEEVVTAVREEHRARRS